ncbi:MAG: oxygenase MpaB family protein [Myxococcales bacterium]|nr:oxygenase MpaB family protein [Myxococcales bacterium]
MTESIDETASKDAEIAGANDGKTGARPEGHARTLVSPGDGPWPEDEVRRARFEMDDVADGVVDRVFADGERTAVNQLLVHIVRNDQLVPADLPEIVQNYLRETSALPGWADPRAIARAQEVFATHGPLCFAVLLGSSLPETYAIRSIAAVLGTTQQLEDHATRRILKTAQMLVDVMSPGGLARQGRGIRAAQRVRLLHASIRHLILTTARGEGTTGREGAMGRALTQTAWPTEERGAPICQQDMAYTVLTFSCVVVDGLRRLDQELSDADADAFVHTWAVVGSLMGVRDGLLPRSYVDAKRLFDAIQAQQAGPSEHGRLLTSRTIDAFEDLLHTRVLPGSPASRGLAVLIVRTVLAPGTAEITGVPPLTLMQRLFAVPAMHVATLALGLVDWIAHHNRPALFIQKLVSRHMVEHLAELSLQDADSLFLIPATLRERWSLQPEPGEAVPSDKPLTERIDWIVGLDDQPALRNLLITQCYHDLSTELAGVLGSQNVNWCTFATWASKTAGRFIRNEEIPEIFRGMLTDSAEFKASAARAIDRLTKAHPDTTLHEDSLLEVAETVAGDVSGQITAGNLAVFSELAPVFSRFVALFRNGKADSEGARALLDGLRVGPSSKGGQSLLREALEHYLEAVQQEDPKQRAANMLVANALTGLHEQIRLQPFIAGSLQAPIDDTLGRLLDRHVEPVDSSSLLGRLHALWDSLSHALVKDARTVWSDLATRELMTLAVPGQILHLGSKLPPPPGGPLYPAVLDPVEGSDAQALLEQYHALDPESAGEVGATDWAELAQRMRYIIALFRSRQCDDRLLQQPFDEAQRSALLAGEVPAGPL